MTRQDYTLTIDPVIMLGAATVIDTQRVIIENCFNSILRDASSLKSEWEGESADAYQTAISKISENASKLTSVFQEYALDLNEIAVAFMTEEQKIRIFNESLPATVFGEG